jgi:hypothetical protein
MARSGLGNDIEMNRNRRFSFPLLVQENHSMIDLSRSLVEFFGQDNARAMFMFTVIVKWSVTMINVAWSLG